MNPHRGKVTPNGENQQIRGPESRRQGRERRGLNYFVRHARVRLEFGGARVSNARSPRVRQGEPSMWPHQIREHPSHARVFALSHQPHRCATRLRRCFFCDSWLDHLSPQFRPLCRLCVCASLSSSCIVGTRHRIIRRQPRIRKVQVAHRRPHPAVFQTMKPP